MNPREALVRRLIAAGKDDAEISAALADFDAKQSMQKSGLPGAAPVDATGPRAGGGGLRPVADAARMAAQGASLGWADEATAGVKSLLGGGPYRDAAAEEQAKVDAARSRMGGLGTVAELAGGFMVPGLGAGKAVSAGAKVATRGAQLAKQIGLAAGSGALAGGLGSAGNARYGEKGEAVLPGAATGAAFGALVAGLGAGGRQLARYVGARNKTTAAEKISDALQDVQARQGYGNTRKETLRFADELSGANQDPASGKLLMDTSREAQELGVDAARANKGAERELEALTNARTASQNTDLATDFAEGVGAKPGASAPRAVDAVKEGIKRFEDAEYSRLFATHPKGVADPAAAKAWTDIATYVKSIPQNLEANQVLSARPLEEIIDKDGLTLRGLHRLKTAIGDRADALAAKKAALNLSDEETGRLKSYASFADRLRDIIKKVPGGDDWAKIQAEGARARALTDALENGQQLMGANPTGYAAEKGIADAGASLPGRGEAGYRQGAASRVMDEGRQATRGSDSYLNRMASQDATQDVVNALAPTPEKAAQYASRMGDRRMMAETNKLQQSKATGQKEILKGARARSTALAFGEAGGIGSVLSLSPSQGAFKLAGGAALAKLFEGNRAKATEEAASQLANLLKSSVKDPEAFQKWMALSMYLERLQRSRMATQAGIAAGANSLTRR